MRKYISPALFLMLITVVAVLLQGCGVNTGQARQYLQQGDKLVGKLQQGACTWQSGAFSLFNNMSDPASVEAAIDKAKASANDLNKTAGAAKAEFAKIKSLGGFPDYVKYADLQIRALDKFQELMTRTNSFFDQFLAMVKSGDVTGITDAPQQYDNEVSKLVEEIDKLDEASQKLKSDKNL